MTAAFQTSKSYWVVIALFTDDSLPVPLPSINQKQCIVLNLRGDRFRGRIIASFRRCSTRVNLARLISFLHNLSHLTKAPFARLVLLFLNTSPTRVQNHHSIGFPIFADDSSPVLLPYINQKQCMVFNQRGNRFSW